MDVITHISTLLHAASGGELTHREEIKYLRLKVLPPIGKLKRYPELTLTVIHAQEKKAPVGREKMEWKLITNLPVDSLTEAVEKIQWYAMR